MLLSVDICHGILLFACIGMLECFWMISNVIPGGNARHFACLAEFCMLAGGLLSRFLLLIAQSKLRTNPRKNRILIPVTLIFIKNFNSIQLYSNLKCEGGCRRAITPSLECLVLYSLMSCSWTKLPDSFIQKSAEIQWHSTAFQLHCHNERTVSKSETANCKVV